MNLLIISSLPKDSTEAERAIRQLTEKAGEHRVIYTDGMNIHHCVGCTACWLKTPGRCAIKDDYEPILKAYLEYDAVIYLCGTALGFIDHKGKNLIDRILPLATMLTFFNDGQMRHVPRYKKDYRFGLLYSGEADDEYLNAWLQRVAVNMLGTSLGAYPIEQAKEAFSCIQ